MVAAVRTSVPLYRIELSQSECNAVVEALKLSIRDLYQGREVPPSSVTKRVLDSLVAARR